MRAPRLIALVALGVPILMAAPRVYAQADAATALTLFMDGKKLVASGDVAGACPKFAASLGLVPKIATALSLADCYERTGMTASAWARYGEAAAMAKAAGDGYRERFAAQHAAALEPKLSKLTILAPSPPSGLEVKRDGEVVARAIFGSALPVDPGKHTIEASAPGKKGWSTTVDVGKEAAKVDVTIPALEEVAPQVAVVPAPTPPVAAPQQAPPPQAPPPAPPPPEKSSWTEQKTAAVAAGSLGVAGVVFGSIFGLVASSKWHDAQTNQCHETLVCTTQGGVLVNDAKSAATLSDVGFIVGALGLGGGIALWLTAPSTTSTVGRISISPTVGATDGVVLRGAF
jgi:hypothetical protein